jgi:hypothetical protein
MSATALPTAAPVGADTWLLELGPQSTLLRPAQAGAAPAPLRWPAVVATLRHAPPTALEIERAIEQVEDAVMPLRARLPAALRLASADPLLHTLARHAGPLDDPAWLPSDAVERLFDRLAARAQGRPATHDALPVDAPHAAALVLLRELLHHWGLDGIALHG